MRHRLGPIFIMALYLCIRPMHGASIGGQIDGPGADDKLYLVEVRPRERKSDPPATNLSPALIATRDGGGELKGHDQAGNPIISVPDEKLEEIRKCPAVRGVSDKVPGGWTRITQMKLSYRIGERPTDELLADLGLKRVEDYEKGSFMTVEPVEGRIDSALVVKLEKSPKLKHVTPLVRVRAH